MKEKIKVLHLIDEMRRGGKERQLMELLKGINKDEFEIHIIAFLQRPDGYDEEAKTFVTSFRYFNRNYRWDLSLIFSIKEYCLENHIDVIYVWDGMTAFYALFISLLTGIPFVNGSIRDTDPRLSYRHIIKRFVLACSKHIVANSAAGLSVYRVDHRGKVIYNGLQLERFTHHRQRTSADFVVGTTANLTDYKDYYTFFDAIAILRKMIPNLSVQVVGGGKLADVYKAYAASKDLLDVVNFIGRVPVTEKYIPEFDVGVLCSFKGKGEGLSNSVIEYMACGVPPVITDIGAAREIVRHGETGLLFPAGDANELAHQIFSLYESERTRTTLARNAKKFVEENFSFQKYIHESESLYRSLMSRKLKGIVA